MAEFLKFAGGVTIIIAIILGIVAFLSGRVLVEGPTAVGFGVSGAMLCGFGTLIEHITAQTEILKQIRDGKTAPAKAESAPKQMTDAEYQADLDRAAAIAKQMLPGDASSRPTGGRVKPARAVPARTEPTAPKL